MEERQLQRVKVGDLVRFVMFSGSNGYGVEALRQEVTGRVVYVNEKHRWFSVEYGQPVMRTSFHFFDIGDTVTKVVAKRGTT